MLLNTDNFNKFNNQSFNLTINKCPTVSDYVSSVSVPGLTLGEAMADTPFITRKEPGDKIVFSVLSVTCILDENLAVWKEVYDWIAGLGFPENFQQYKSFNRNIQTLLPPEETFSDATLVLYNNQQKPIMNLKFYDMFPIALGDIPLSTQETGDETLSIVMDFQYRSYGVEIIQ